MVLDVGVKRMERRSPGAAHVHSECIRIIISLFAGYGRDRIESKIGAASNHCQQPPVPFVILRPAFFAGRRTYVLACSAANVGVCGDAGSFAQVLRWESSAIAGDSAASG